MEYYKVNNYDELSLKAAEIMLETVKNKNDALICVATGSTPTGAYEIFTKKLKDENIDYSKIKILKLDEWLGISKSDPASCEVYIKENILTPLEISSERYFSFNLETDDPNKECNRISDIIYKEGPIDLCILGIGTNGHLGLNEPGEKLIPHCHISRLNPKTKNHTMLTKTNHKVTYGITIGLKEILASKEILLMVSGNNKREAFDKFMEGNITTWLPSSFLWLHLNVKCIADMSIYTTGS